MRGIFLSKNEIYWRNEGVSKALTSKERGRRLFPYREGVASGGTVGYFFIHLPELREEIDTRRSR